MTVRGTPEEAVITGRADFPVNRGALCVKGWSAGATLAHPERLVAPLVRDARGRLQEVSWDEALGRIAERMREVQGRFGDDAVGVFGSGALTNEKAYLLGKLARVALRTSNIDYNGRYCMSSGAAAGMRAFGIDRGLPFPLEDLVTAEVVLLAGGNIAETMPPFMQHLDAQRERGGQLIVVDPRRTPTAAAATLHLAIRPGTDAALACGILHVLVRDGLVDEAYIRARTEGFDRVRGAAATYWPERASQITGVPEARIIEAAHLIGHAKTAMVLTGRGPEQQSRGVDNTLAYINIALARGLVGRPSSGYGCLTGQGNGQGGREHGQKADQLPGYRRIDDPAARRHLAAVWGVPEESLPGPGKSAYEMLSTIGEEGGVRALLVVGSNVVVSSPGAREIEARLRSIDFLTVVDFFMSETAKLADVILPAAQWAEEEGTMTNLEGRVLLRRRAFAKPAGVRTDVEILCGLGRALGHEARFRFDDPRAVFEELRRASAGGLADYAGITYERLEAGEGVFWPCPDEAHPGTPRLFGERFPTPSGRARFHAVHYRPPAEEPNAEYPLYLTTGRLLAHYQTGTQTRRVRQLDMLAPAPVAQIHPTTASRHGLTEGCAVALATPRATARFTVQITPDVQVDTIFVPFHWGGEGAVNRLTNPALDPVSRMPEFKVCAVRVQRLPLGKGDQREAEFEARPGHADRLVEG
jgi:assimilatory nitrate reductase catalytic subunit